MSKEDMIKEAVEEAKAEAAKMEDEAAADEQDEAAETKGSVEEEASKETEESQDCLLYTSYASVRADNGRKTERTITCRLLCDIVRVIWNVSAFSKENMGVYAFCFGGVFDCFMRSKKPGY